MAQLSIRWIRGNENGVVLEVMVQTGKRVHHHTRAVPLPAGARIELDLPFGIREGVRTKGLPGEDVIISVPTGGVGFKGVKP